MVCASLLAAAGSALAAEKIKLKLGGFFNAAAVAINQDDALALRTESIVTSGEIFVQGWTNLDDGWSVGFRTEFELERDNGYKDAFQPNVQYEDDLIDEVWAYVEGPYGRLEFGQQDGVADQMMFFSPSVSQSIRVNNPDIYLLECPITSFCPESQGGRPFTPWGLQLRTDMHVSEDFTKVIYYTPRFSGFQAGVSYTPELARNFSGFATRQSNQVNQQSEIWEFGLNFAESFAGVDIGLSAAYLTGKNENPVNFGYLGFSPDDVEELGFGARLGYREWSVGGSYRRTNVLGGGNILQPGFGGFSYNVFQEFDTQIWEAGLKYETGPWSVGLNYVKAESDMPGVVSTPQGEGVELAAGVVLGPGIQMSAGYQHYNFDGPFDVCDPFGACDTVKAGLLYVETSLTF
jgi:predicted porin